MRLMLVHPLGSVRVLKLKKYLHRDYDAALVNLGRARRFYTEAGPQGVVGLSRTQDPEVVVQTAAIRDGRRLKSEALRALRSDALEKRVLTNASAACGVG